MMPLIDKILKSNLTYKLVRTVISVLFLAAGIIKIQNPSAFAEVIAAFGLVPPPLPDILALTLPPLEIVFSILLLIDVKGSLSVITIMTLIFAIILAYGIHMGLDIDCGCYGPGNPEAEAFHNLKMALWRDFGILTGIVYLYWFRYAHVIPLRLSWRTVGANKKQKRE